MTIEISSTAIKRLLVAVVILAALGGIGYWAYNHFETKKVKEELASNINKAGALSLYIIEDYGVTWQASIQNKTVMDENGNPVYNDDFNSALPQRSQYYRNIGVLPILDSLKAAIQAGMKYIDTDDKEDAAFVSSFEKVAKLINLAIEPTGSLFTFTQNVNVIRSDFQSSLDQLAIYHPVASQDSIRQWGLSLIEEKRTQYAENFRKQHAIDKEQMKKEGFHMITDGIYYKTLSKGDGKTHCTASSYVTVDYTGSLMNGIVFDSSKEPSRLPILNVIKGWQIALPYMTLGETAEFVLPYDLAYGENGAGPIPPYANIRFKVKLLSIE